jgi:uncharacterized cupredoxin-like copper-binding protein
MNSMKRIWLPVACLLAFGGCELAGASAEVRTITVEIEHSSFIPNEIDVRAGERVRFVVVNNDPIDHEFIIGDERIQSIHEKGTELHHGARDGEVSVPAGETRETSYTFEESGALIYGCHLPRHYGYGMKGDLRIR